MCALLSPESTDLWVGIFSSEGVKMNSLTGMVCRDCADEMCYPALLLSVDVIAYSFDACRTINGCICTVVLCLARDSCL